MNKKVILGIVVALVVVVGAVAAVMLIKNHNNNQEEEMDTTNQTTNNISDSADTSASKILVAYFSRADENYNVGTVEVGNTELLAKEIIAQTGADEFKITPVTPYPANYQETVDKATEERNNNARPEYVGEVADFAQYDTIFIGYPIWWGDMPMMVYKFLEDYDFSGKTVIPFNTHEGSGSAGTYATIADKLSTANVNTNGLAITGSTARTNRGIGQVKDWLKELGY